MVFDGADCWNDRMEHVGKHLESQAQGKVVVRQGDDQYLLDWAFQEGIVEEKPSGGWKLVLGAAGSLRRTPKVLGGDEEDAECEDE